MSEVNIVDASAALAYLQGESGAEVLEEALDQRPSWITTVNYCEVLSKLCEKGMPPAEAQAAVQGLGLEIIDFDQDLAVRSAVLRTATMSIGASLGDRACLALAQRTAESAGVPAVYTAERSWGKLKWQFKIKLVRHGRP